MTVWWRTVYACVLVVSIAIAMRLIHGKQKRLDLTRVQRLFIGGAAFAGAMIGSKVPFLGDRGWSSFYDGTVWFADGKTILGGIVGGYAAVELAKWIASPLVMEMFLVLAIASLRFRIGLIWFATLGAMICYMLLVGSVDATWFDSKHSTPVLTQAITLCSLAATGVVLGQIVRTPRRMADAFLERAGQMKEEVKG